MNRSRRTEDSKNGGANTVGGVQSLKVRRVKEKLFLHEMERLADEMCRHYVDVRTQVSAVPPKDLRSHVDLIHNKVDKVVGEELDGGPSHPHGTSGAQGVLRYGSEAGEDGGQVWASEFRKSKPLRFKEDGWTAQSSRGVSLRLRRMQPFVPKSKETLSEMSDSEFGTSARHENSGRKRNKSWWGEEGAVKNHLIDEDETPSFVVQRFNTEDPTSMALLDMNMDGNTSCLSARKPKKITPADPVAMSQHKLQSTIPKPLPQFRPFERERLPTPPEQRTNFQPTRSENERTLNIAASVAGERLQSATWSPRDRMITNAMEKKHGGYATNSPLRNRATGVGSTPTTTTVPHPPISGRRR